MRETRIAPLMAGETDVEIRRSDSRRPVIVTDYSFVRTAVQGVLKRTHTRARRGQRDGGIGTSYNTVPGRVPGWPVYPGAVEGGEKRKGVAHRRQMHLSSSTFA